MIQRIQTIFLLLASIALFTAVVSPMGYFIENLITEHSFTALGVDLHGEHQSTWGLFCILLLSSIVALSDIFLFKNRILQMRIATFNCLLIVGYYIAFAAFYFVLDSDSYTFRFGWAFCLPIIALILQVMAIRAIAKDEVMVKAADRLR